MLFQKYLLARKQSLLRLFLYTGPALMVSVAYMDPGNYGTDIAGGASLNYSLLWVVWLSSGMAMMLQYLSGKIGIATGQSLPEIIREKLKKKIFIIPYWLAAEAASAATDLAEYLGTVIALNLLFGIPMIYAAVLGALDVILILALTTRKFRVLEQVFILLISIISFGYLYEVFITKPDPSAILYHSFVPLIANSNALLITVGIIGATVMPHALFVHSWFTKNKSKDKSIQEKRVLRKLHLRENVVILVLAGMVNAAIMIMAAAAFNAHYSNIASISDAYKTLIPLFGAGAGIVFVITLLSSGISSSIVGTLAGQAVMEGLLGMRVNIWLRRIVTRFINVIPTTIALLLGFDPLSILVYSQVILSLMIPLPMIPLVLLTRNKEVMGEFVNRNITTIISIAFVGIILAFNSYLIATSIKL
ncbi:MAG: divalent metal cation transporter [Candidatus Nitrosopolaris wilkensis]|nr:MAG: divalent metal cation transporter [Candidatus Nitrosopolaris wilkensis]